jgi:hypothetical protein
MSYQQEYFAPNGTKFKWSAKHLRNGRWCCNIIDQLDYPKHYPARIMAYVQLVDNAFKWYVDVTGWDNKITSFRGESSDALVAISDAEKISVYEAKKLYPDWVITALENKWRPPA